MDSLPPNDELTLEQLSRKTILMLKLDLMWRSSDLARVYRHKDCLSIQENCIKFRTYKAKEQRQGLLSNWVSVYAVPQLPKLCPVVTLKAYLTRTKHLEVPEVKLTLKSTTHHTCGLFLARQPRDGKPASVGSQWIAKETLSALKLCGVDTSNYKAHSTRGAAASKALSNGIRKSRIMEQCKLKTVPVFIKHYLRAESAVVISLDPISVEDIYRSINPHVE